MKKILITVMSCDKEFFSNQEEIIKQTNKAIQKCIDEMKKFDDYKIDLVKLYDKKNQGKPRFGFFFAIFSLFYYSTTFPFFTLKILPTFKFSIFDGSQQLKKHCQSLI